ncbi:MAG: XRE family transcriptional regulator [Clostridia bacterium]|nr:XRE family transcriptional regulator [Clostridia bacterium]
MYSRIYELREDADLSQADIARILNVSQATYSRYENGKLDIPTSVLIQLAQYYKVSIDYILGIQEKK